MRGQGHHQREHSLREQNNAEKCFPERIQVWRVRSMIQTANAPGLGQLFAPSCCKRGISGASALGVVSSLNGSTWPMAGAHFDEVFATLQPVDT